MGLGPHTQKWLKYWDRQYSRYLTGEDPNAIWLSSIDGYRAVMKYAFENTTSMTAEALRAVLTNRFKKASNAASSVCRQLPLLGVLISMASELLGTFVTTLNSGSTNSVTSIFITAPSSSATSLSLSP